MAVVFLLLLATLPVGEPDTYTVDRDRGVSGNRKATFHIDHSAGYFRVFFIDNGRPIVVQSRSYHESHTQYDREVFAREWLPQENRTRTIPLPKIPAGF